MDLGSNLRNLISVHIQIIIIINIATFWEITTRYDYPMQEDKKIKIFHRDSYYMDFCYLAFLNSIICNYIK